MFKTKMNLIKSNQVRIDSWIPYTEKAQNCMKSQITIDYCLGLPLEYESFLVEKYSSFITTCRYIEAHYASYDMVHMLVFKDNMLDDILAFGIKGNTALCFNSLTAVSQEVINACINKLFEQNNRIKKVKIVASYVDYNLKLSLQDFKSDDYILPLPSTLEEYYTELGPRTRKHIKQRKDKLSRDFGDVRFVIKIKQDIDEASFDKIIELNRQRMKHKGKVSGIDEDYRNNLYKFTQSYGYLIYLELDGVVVAGSISTIVNKEIFVHVIAHDNNYSKYNVGEVCAFYTIETAIEEALLKFHFLWGESELKKRFLAKPHFLYFYVVYKSFTARYLLNKIKILAYNLFASFKHSKMAEPIRKLVILYHKKTA